MGIKESIDIYNGHSHSLARKETTTMKNPVTGKEVSGFDPGDFGTKPLRLSQFAKMIQFAQKMYGNRDPFVVFHTPEYEGHKDTGHFIPNGFWDVEDLDFGYIVLEDNTGAACDSFSPLSNENPENRKGFIRKAKPSKKAKK